MSSTCLSAAAAVASVSPAAGASGRRAAARAGRWTLQPTAAFYLQASITLAFLAGSAAPTPLYAVYRTAWGFSATMLTVVFAVYALAVLTALLVAGRLSDHVGRRPVLVAATLVQAATMLLFAHAGGLGDLLVARTVQGLSAGAALAAVGAGLLDLDKARGAVANAVAPMLGTALGGGLAGLIVQFLPAPTHLVYLLLAVVFVGQAIGLALIAETAQRGPGAWGSLRPRLFVPPAVRGTLLRVAPALVAVWALAGFYASLGPTLLRTLVGSGSALLGGVALFVLAGSGAVAVLVAGGQAPRRMARIGMAMLAAGLAIVLFALSARSSAVFLAGTAVAGVGFGLGFQGALRLVVVSLAPAERAGALAVVFVIAYLAMGAPAVAAGLDVALRGDIVGTARVFAATLVGLAALAWQAARPPVQISKA